MFWRLKALCGAVALVLLFAPLAACQAATQVPQDADAFTAFVAAKLRAAAPSITVQPAGKLYLQVNGPNGAHSAYLNNIYRLCAKQPEECDERVTFYATQMAGLYQTPDAPPDAASLRVVARPSAYVDQMRAAAPDSQPPAKPLVGDLWLLVAVDRPTVIGFLDRKTMETMGLSTEKAMAIGRRNMRSSVKGAIQAAIAGFKPDVIGTMMDDAYASSAMAFPKLWKPLADLMGGELLVSAPGPDVLLYADGRKPGTAKILKKMARDAMSDDDHPFSDAVYRWSADGWVLVDTAAP